MKEKRGFAIAALVLGILSMTIGIAAGMVFGLAGIICGIISFTRKEQSRGVAIGGIVTSNIGAVLGSILLITVILVFSNTEEREKNMVHTADELSNSYGDNVDVFSGNSYQFDDGSVIYFNDDGSFYWYQSDSDHEDNYYSGTYECYKGMQATEYIVNQLPDYNVTEEEMKDYFARNTGSEFYNEENFVYLALNDDKVVIDGEKSENVGTRRYMGFYLDGCYDAANMDTASYVKCTKVD